MGLIMQLAAYGLVGVINTGVGFLVIAGLALSHVEPWIANACGYAIGLMTSFALNKRFTFRSGGGGTAGPFLLAFCFCYAVNLAVLFVSAPLAAYHLLVPQILAVLAYNLCFFLALRSFVFAESQNS